jgi:hypothetical protein
MLRELISRFSSSVSEHMVAPRRRCTAPIKVWFDPDTKDQRAQELARASFLAGETVDLSRTGVAFIVPAIRIKEKYLVNQDRPLNIEIDLPSGKVRLRALGKRYEKVGIHISTERFLVGVEITSIAPADKEAFDMFLKGRLRRPSAQLELGID